MYYTENIIGGVLHYKNSPKGKWIKFTEEMLMKRITELEERLLHEHLTNTGDK